MSGVEWTPALIVLAFGLVGGAVLVWRLRGGGEGPTPAVPPVERRDLQARSDALIAQLRELQDTAAKRTPDQLARERYALELDAARALAAWEASAPKPAKASRRAAAGEVAAPAPARSSSLRGFLWGVGSCAAIGGLLFYVSQSAAPRGQGGSVTGNTPGMGGASSAPSSPPLGQEEAELRAALERNPDDFDARIDLAQVYLARQDMMGVWNETQYVLQRSPGHPRALAYQALVRVAMGQPDVAVDMLKQAIATAPDQIEPYLHLCLVYVRLGRTEQARAAMAQAKKRFPDEAQRLDELFVQMQRGVRAEPPAELEGNPHEGVVPPPAGTAAAGRVAEAPAARGAPAPRGASAGVAGVLDIDPSLRGQIAPGAIVFVTVRAAGSEGGPPVAVKRLPASFPLAFELSAADSMMGGELPAQMRIEARVDSDGDPLSRSPADPSVRVDGVRLGAASLRLVLKR